MSLFNRKSQIGPILSELKEIGKECNSTHSWLALAMAERLEEGRVDKKIITDVAKDIRLMARDVSGYNPSAASRLFVCAQKLDQL